MPPRSTATRRSELLRVEPGVRAPQRRWKAAGRVRPAWSLPADQPPATHHRETHGEGAEAEAEPYREVAKGVIGQARENLGVQFKLAVQDRQWHIAAAVGDRIIKEFPNSRMAQEIREVIDGIREQASRVVSS